MDAKTLPKGISKEDSPNRFEPGIYEHKETGAKFITSEGEEGYIQADALHSPVWNGGWKRVGDVPTRMEQHEQRQAQEAQALKEAKALIDAKAAEAKVLEEEKVK